EPCWLAEKLGDRAGKAGQDVAAVERVPHVQGLRGLGVSWSPYLYLSPFRPDDPDKACPCCKVPLSLRRHPRLVLGWRGHFDGQIRCEGDRFILVAGHVGRCLSLAHRSSRPDLLSVAGEPSMR